MRKIKVGLVGASGRMGKEIAQVIHQSSNCELYYPISRDEKLDKIKSTSVDVWIDFSTPEAFSEIVKVAIRNETPLVSGTTGFNEKQKQQLVKASNNIPILWSSNMSMGVAVLNEAIRSFSAVSHFDFQIEEIHHNKKKDSPSGTAITLQENLTKIIGKKIPDPISIRGGGVYGIHKAYAMSDEEIITFEHNAINRTVFAKGAVTSAVWIVKRKPGLYEIRDVLFGNKK